MTITIHQPHDKLFKRSMANLQVARDFFESHLPPEILKQINLDTLKLEKNTFVDSFYESGEVDLLYSVEQGNNLAYLHLHCENQSKIEKDTPFRLLVYKTKLMQAHVEQYPDKPYPIIYSIVIYTGKKPWDAPLDIVDLMSAPKDLAREVLFRPYQLIDIHRMSDDEIERRRLCGLMEFAFKYRAVQDYAKFLEKTLIWINSLSQEGPNYAKGVLEYLVDGVEMSGRKLFIQKVNEHLSDAELRGEAMTLAQEFREEGRQEAIQQTMTLAQEFREEGRQEGIHTGEASMLARLLKLRFREIPQHYQTQIAQANSETLLVWSERILNAQSLEDVFA